MRFFSVGLLCTILFIAGCSKWNLDPKELRTDPLAVDLAYVTGGTFNMGSNDGEADEKPVHSVTVKNFYISKYEVTNREFQNFCTQTNRTLPPAPGWGRPESYPVVNITYDDATAYCQWLGQQKGKRFRLPTEAEWEYAARGGKQSRGYIYSGSNTASAVAWYTSTATNSSVYPVGLKLPNELGIYDMSGNAWEWCSDWYGSYSSAAATNPTGAASGSSRVQRGAGYDGGVSDMRIANRGALSPGLQSRSAGFRVVQDE
ncbi:formylglycine-generating enzyme family protein [Spirosoma koreense]